MSNKRRRIGAIGMGGILCASVLLAADWPQWRGANRDATVTQFTPPASWPKELQKKWSTNVGLGDATPALAGDKLYTFTRQGDEEVITALSANDGKQVWQEKYASPPVTGAAQRHPGPRSSPAVAEGKVVTLGVTEILSCFDAETGTVAWRKEFKSDYPKVPQFFTATSPIIVDGLCITHLGGQGKGAMMAFALSTGDLKWKWDGDAPAYSSPIVMTVDGVKMVVEETEKMVVGISVADGKLLWQVPFVGRGMGGYNAPTPIIDGNIVVYSGAGRGMKAAQIEKQGDAFAAKELWSNSDAATKFNTAVLSNGLLFGISDPKSNFFCVNEKDGKTLWVDATNRQSQGFGSMVAAGPVIFALTPKPELTVFSASGKGYSELAKYKVSESETYAYPVISGKNIFIKDKDSVTMFSLE